MSQPNPTRIRSEYQADRKPISVEQWEKRANAAESDEQAQTQLLYHQLLQLRIIKLILLWALLVIPAIVVVAIIIVTYSPNFQ